MIYRVFNQGEIPAIAHGWRSIVALTPGRKWITVIDWTTLETARIEVAAWEKLKPLQATGINRRKVRLAIRHRLRYVAATRAITQALSQLKGSAP